jgi:hypothetical protein
MESVRGGIRRGSYRRRERRETTMRERRQDKFVMFCHTYAQVTLLHENLVLCYLRVPQMPFQPTDPEEHLYEFLVLGSHFRYRL